MPAFACLKEGHPKTAGILAEQVQFHREDQDLRKVTHTLFTNKDQKRKVSKQ